MLIMFSFNHKHLYLCIRMFKLITVAALGYLFYRLVASPKSLERGEETEFIASEPDDDEFVDYEELE